MRRIWEIGRVLSRVDRIHMALGLVLLVGLALRLYGIRWGLPDAMHPTYSYHPDESLHLLAARMLARGEMIGKHFMYGGTLYFTILNAYVFFAERFGDWIGGFNRLADAILLGRYFLVGIALLTILLVYECARVHFDRVTAVLAALILAIVPAHIICSQHVRPDEIAALFPVLTVLLCSRILSNYEHRGYRIYMYAGLTVGISTAFRFPLAMLLLAPVTAHLMARAGAGGRINVLGGLFDPRLVALGLCVIVGYVIASPYTFLYPQWFIEGLKIQWVYQSSPFPDAVGAGPRLYQYGWTMLRQALGYPLYVLSAIGVVLAIVKRSKADLVILAAAVPYFVLTTFTSWVVVRYTLPLLPLFAILAARATVYFAQIVPRYRLVTHSVFSAALVVTLLADYAYLKVAADKNVRDIATQWIKENVPRGSSILIVRTYLEDEFFNPVVPNGYDGVIFPLDDRSDSRLLFWDNRFDFLVLHEVLYRNMERLGERHPYKHMWQFYQSLLESRYKAVTAFKQPTEVLGMDFSSWFTSEDYLIVNPGIRIYRYQD